MDVDEYVTIDLGNGATARAKVKKISKTIGGPIINDNKEIPAGKSYVMKRPNPFKKRNTGGFGTSDNPNNPDYN